MSNKNTVFIIPFSHLDLFWAGSREECLSRGIQIIRTALSLLVKYSDYRFMIESTSFLEHYLDSFPTEKERVKQLVKSGQLEVIPMRSITYTQLPSGETLVRNILYGQEFCQKELGTSSKVVSMSDIPGISPQMPQIAARSGMDALFLSHGCPPHTDHIYYKALDGTSIKSYAPIHYAKCRALLGAGETYEGMLEREKEFNDYFKAVDYDMLCQWGADLCVINENVVNNIQRWTEEGHHPLEFCTFTEFFSKHYPDNPKEISGEIPSLWPNVESSWPDLWPLDLPCENAMFDAELFSVLNSNYSHKDTLRKAWDWLLDSMDHNQNGIGGDYSDQDKIDLKIAAKLAAEQVSKQMAWALASQVNSPHPEAFPIVIFNPLSWERSERICARTALYGFGTAKFDKMKENYKNFRLIDQDGNEIPFRTIKHRAMIADTIEIEFFAESVPAFGAKVYYLEAAERKTVESPFSVDDGNQRDKTAPDQYAGISSVENDFLRLDIDRVTGEFSVFDKKQKCFVFKNAGILALEEKRGDYICKMDLTGRVIPAVLENLELIDHSPVAYRICLTGKVYNQSYKQTITLDANSPTIDIENKIDWKGGCYARFEQAFPFESEEDADIHYGVPFGSVKYPETIYSGDLSFDDLVTPERGDNPDDAIHKIRLVSKWLAMKDSKNSVTIGMDHRMWELDGNTARNCMFRSIGNTSGGYIMHEDGTKEGVCRPPKNEYTFNYKISIQDSNSVVDGHCGWELNRPLYPVGIGISNVSKHAGIELPIMPDSTGTSINICNVKPALADPHQVVFRSFETAGRSDSLTLPKVPGKVWYESNLMEDDAVPCSTNKISFSPYEIKTLILK